MTPRAQITAWRASAPWPQDEQVEQDLVLSRALTAIFGRPALREALAFRADVIPLLRDSEGYDVDDAASLVNDRLVARLPEEPWKSLGREQS